MELGTCDASLSVAMTQNPNPNADALEPSDLLGTFCFCDIFQSVAVIKNLEKSIPAEIVIYLLISLFGVTRDFL